MQTARTSLPISIPAHRSTAARIIIGSFPTDSSQRLVHNFFLGPTAPFKGALRQPGQFCLREKKILAVTQGSHPARWPSAYAHPRLFSSPWVAARSWMFCFVILPRSVLNGFVGVWLRAACKLLNRRKEAGDWVCFVISRRMDLGREFEPGRAAWWVRSAIGRRRLPQFTHSVPSHGFPG